MVTDADGTTTATTSSASDNVSRTTNTHHNYDRDHNTTIFI